MNADIELLRSFVAAAEELHFARAAEHRHLDPSGISRQIRLLEQRIGVQLFDRTTRHVSLTEAGASLLPAAREVVHAHDEFDARARIRASGQRGELRVGLMIHAAGAPVLAALHDGAARLGVRLRLVEADFGDTSAGLRSGTTDLAIVFEPFDDRGLVTLPLFALDRVAVVRRDHRLATRSSVSFADLADEPWVAPPDTDQAFHDFWMAAERRADHPLLVGATCRTAEEGLLAAMAGSGIAVGATSRNGFTFDGVAIIPIDDLPPCGVAVAHRRDGADERAVALATHVRLAQRASADV